MQDLQAEPGDMDLADLKEVGCSEAHDADVGEEEGQPNWGV